MNAYVWEEVDQLTTNYHCYGGLMVVAEDEAHVRELVAVDDGEKKIRLTEEEWEAVIVYPLQGDPAPRVFVFRDAGCC